MTQSQLLQPGMSTRTETYWTQDVSHDIESGATFAFESEPLPGLQTQPALISHNTTTFSTLAPCFDRHLALLDSFTQLERNWDSYGAHPTSIAAIDKTKLLLIAAQEYTLAEAGEDSIPTLIAPLGGGGIQIEWIGSRYELEVEIGPDGRVGYLLVPGLHGAHTHEEREDVDWREIVGLLRSVVIS